MARVCRRRIVASIATACVATTAIGLLTPTPASAATTQLFNQPFHNATANGDGAVALPAGANTGVTNVACLTASGNTSTAPKSCSSVTDAAGAGKLRLTDNTTNKAGGLFAATSVPASQGLDVKFNLYQYGGGNPPADGMGFALAAVDPTNPLSPANMGPVGGSLGYSVSGSVKGLAYGYLGVGFDVYGNYSNASFQGKACEVPPYIATSGQVKGQVVIKGPGNNTTGYCAINSTAASTTSSALALRSNTRTGSKVPVEVVTNPGKSAVTTTSGITVPAKSYAIQFTPVGGTARTLTGTLPKVTSGLYPSNFVDGDGYPRQLAFGWVGSTGSLTDYHEVDEASVVSLRAVPELNVAQTAYTQPSLSPGDPVSYAVKAGVEPGVDESEAISVTDTLPNGVTPVGGSGDGWVCAPPAGQKITCTNSSGPFQAGSTLPTLNITGTVTTAGITPETIRANSIVTASSNDANPAYSNNASAGAPAATPSNLALSPASGPTGTAVTVTGTDIAGASAIQVGTAAELAAGTAATLPPCPGNKPANGCFTKTDDGKLQIAAMPQHATGAVEVKIITQGAATSVGYTYTTVPGTPATTATAGAASATVTWTVPASGGSAISGYVLTPYKDGVAQTPISYGANVTSAPFTGLTVGASYTYTVAAKNGNGTGVPSSPSNAVVPYTLPSAPTIGTVTVGSSAAKLSWAAPSSNGYTDITGYVVTPYLDGVAQTAQTFRSTATTQPVTGLTAGRAYTFTVAAINAAGTGPASAQSAAVTPNEGPAITSTPGKGEVGAAFSHQFTTTGGTGTLTYAVASGSLPDGLTLSPTGLLSGTPSGDGSFTFKVSVTDSDDAGSSKSFTVEIAAAPRLTFTSPLPRVDVGDNYRQDLSRSGGTGPFRFSVSDGTLPAGLSLDEATGVLSGTPTAGGNFSFTVKVTDAFDQSDTKEASLAVRAAPKVTLSVSDGSVRFGGDVKLTASLDPSATGPVTFTASAPDGGKVTLGSADVTDGTAAVRVTPTRFGRYTVSAEYAGSSSYLPATSGTQTVDVNAWAGEAILTEFRTSGPSGADDSYVEIYNVGPAMPLAGFALQASSGAKVVLPADAPVLDTNRTYLVAGSDFSLGAFATPDLRISGLGHGGLRLVAPDVAGTATDAVGPASGYHLGRALPDLAGTPSDQWAYVRIEASGRPTNTGSNGADFALVSSTGGMVGGVQSMRGSASPTGLADDWQHNTQLNSYLLDRNRTVDATPNREYVVGKPGTLTIRRTITNAGTSTVTSAKVRVTALSEANGVPYASNSPAPTGSARLRAVDPKTATSQVDVAGRGSVSVQNLSVDAPITDRAGGGLNSTFTVPLPSGGLAPGASVDVAFSFDVDARGTFWFGYDIDARTSQGAGLRALKVKSVQSAQAKVEQKLDAKGLAPTKATTTTVSGQL